MTIARIPQDFFVSLLIGFISLKHPKDNGILAEKTSAEGLFIVSSRPQFFSGKAAMERTQNRLFERVVKREIDPDHGGDIFPLDIHSPIVVSVEDPFFC